MHPEVFCKNDVLSSFTKYKKASVPSCKSLPCSFIKRDSGKGVFKNTFFIEHLRATASKYNVTFTKETLLEHAFFSKLIFSYQNSILIFLEM